MVEVGETVWRTPVGFHEMIGPGHQTKQRFKGRVIYVHPEGRYHRVVFDLPGGRVIERGGTAAVSVLRRNSYGK